MKSKLLHLLVGTSLIGSLVYLNIIASLTDQNVYTIKEAVVRVAVVIVVLAINVIAIPYAQKEKDLDGRQSIGPDVNNQDNSKSK